MIVKEFVYADDQDPEAVQMISVGDVAFITDPALVRNAPVFVKIAQIETEITKEKVSKGFFRKSEEKEYNTLKKVWWTVVGDMTNQMHSKTYGTERYRWHYMINKAEFLLRQAELLK